MFLLLAALLFQQPAQPPLPLIREKFSEVMLGLAHIIMKGVQHVSDR